MDIDNLTSIVELRHHLTEEINSKTAERNELDSIIKEHLGSEEVGYIGGREAVRWTTSSRRAVDVTRLRQEDPDTAAKFMRTSQVRRFEVVVSDD